MRVSKGRLRALVTGGAGFIGSELTRQLLGEGFRVTVLDDLSFGLREHIWPGVEFVKGDIRSKASLRRALCRRYDRVYHLAAIHFIPYCNAHPDEALSINIGGTWHLLSELRKEPPGRIFFASTAAVYDTKSHAHRTGEAPKPMDIYGLTKLACEHLIRLFHEDTGTPAAVGRLFNAYGPRETNPHLIPHILSQLKRGIRTLELGNLKPFRDYIHTSDMARAIRAQVEATKKGMTLVNIASGSEYRVEEVVEVFSKLLGETLSVRSRPTLRRKAERAHLLGDLRPLRKLTGWKPEITFRQGLRDLLESEGLL